MYNDVEAAFDHLNLKLGIRPDQIVLYGAEAIAPGPTRMPTLASSSSFFFCVRYLHMSRLTLSSPCMAGDALRWRDITEPVALSVPSGIQLPLHTAG